MRGRTDGDGLPRALEGVALLLREDVVPRDQWRRGVLRAVSDDDGRAGRGAVHPAAAPRRWAMHPALALAAGLACAFLGSVATLALVTARQPASPTAATATGPASVVRFALDAPTATRVHIVGDFNDWDPRSLPLQRSSDGRTWEVEVPLAPGRYSYSFMVDGALARDPRAPRAADDDFGSPNSVVLVTGT